MEKRRKIEDVCVFLISIVLTIIFLLILLEFIQFPGIVVEIFIALVYFYITLIFTLSVSKLFKKANKKIIIFLVHLMFSFFTLSSSLLVAGGKLPIVKNIGDCILMFSFSGMLISLIVLQKYEDET